MAAVRFLDAAGTAPVAQGGFSGVVASWAPHEGGNEGKSRMDRQATVGLENPGNAGLSNSSGLEV